MLIAEKNEAFNHNSCKKLAQLSKVVYVMLSKKQSRKDQIRDLRKDFDSEIEFLLKNYNHELQQIFDELYKFRKSCIRSNCKEYGVFYKQMKSEFQSFINGRKGKYADLLEEVRQLIKDINNFQMNALKLAAQFIDYSSQFESEIEKKRKPLTPTSQDVRHAVRHIYEKIVDLEDHMGEIDERVRDEYFIKTRDLKLQNKKDIQNLRSDFKHDLKDKKHQIISLNHETRKIGFRYNEIVQSHSDFMKNEYRKRCKLISDTTQEVKSIQNEIDQLSTQPIDDYKIILRNLQEKRALNHAQFRQIFEQLKKELHNAKHHRHNINRAKTSEMSRKEKEYYKKHKKRTQQYLHQQNKLIEFHNYCKNFIDKGLEDSNKLLYTLQVLIERSLSNEKLKSKKMRLSYKRYSASASSSFKEMQQQYLETIDSNVGEFNVIKSRLQFNFRDEMNTINELKKNLEERKAAQKKEINAAKDKVKHDYDAAKEKLIARLQKKKDDNSKSYSQKDKLNRKRITDVETNLKNELKKKEEKIESANNQKFTELKNSFGELNFKKEEEEHKLNVIKLNAKVNYWNQHVSETQKNAENKVDYYEKQIKSLNKSIRKFKRAVKSERIKLDENYEIQIQIRQVDIKDKIDNLSKLYSKEENERGTEIIYEIRKVNETKNRTLNLLIRKQREKEKMISDQNEKKEQMKKTISDYENNVFESNLRAQLQEKREYLDQYVSEDYQKLAKKISELNNQIAQNKSTYQKYLNDIKASRESEMKAFKENEHALKKQKDQINHQKNEKIKAIDTEYRANLKKMKDEHQRQVTSIKQRIEHAQKQYNEYSDQITKEILQSKLKNIQEENIKKEHFRKMLSFDDFPELDQKIVHLIEKKIGIMKKTDPSEMRKIDELNIKNLKGKMAQANENLFKDFEIHINNMKSIISNPESAPNPEIKSKKIKASLSQRAESSNMILFEHRPYKNIQLVTPQIVC